MPLPTKQINKLFSIAALFFTASVPSTAAAANSAPYLHPIPAQFVSPGRALEYKVSASDEDGTVPSIRMLNAPVNATLTDDDGNGSRTFTWLAPANVANETIIIFQAIDADDPSLISTQRLVLRRDETAQPTTPSNSTTPETQANSQPVQSRAPTLPEIGLQTLRINENYQLFVRLADDNGGVGGVLAHSLPAGATFEDAFDGGRVFKWTPTVEQIGDHRVKLIAFDATDTGLRSHRDVEFKVMASNSYADTNNNVENEPADPLKETVDSASNGAYIEPVSFPIVSAVQVVSFRVVPHMPDNSTAILYVDRLPGGASFDDNFDGSRTFHWPTTAKDQGPHVFRFTALHHADSYSRVSKEVMIVVGDPSAPGTQPANDS